MSLRRKLAGVIVGAALAAVIPMGTASADDFDCSLQFEPPPECFDPPPEDPPPPPPGMTPVGDMMMGDPRPMPEQPMPSQPGETCRTFGFESDAVAWELNNWRIQREYTLRISGRLCRTGFQFNSLTATGSRDIALPQDPRLRSVSQARRLGPDGVGTGEAFVGVEVYAVFCDDPRSPMSCTTYRHVILVNFSSMSGTTARAALFITGPTSTNPPPI